MSTEDAYDADHIDREIRINELRHEAEALSGGNMASWEKDGSPPELMEQFWEHVLEYEQAPWTSYFQQLQETGIELPAPESLDDEALAKKLKELIARLAEIHVYLSSTDHLDDRELYVLLWSEVLHERTKDVPIDGGAANHLDLVSSGSERDVRLYLKYYADEPARQHWQESFPDYKLPAHKDPPYDRDRRLPKSQYG